MQLVGLVASHNLAWSSESISIREVVATICSSSDGDSSDGTVVSEAIVQEKSRKIGVTSIVSSSIGNSELSTTGSEVSVLSGSISGLMATSSSVLLL